MKNLVAYEWDYEVVDESGDIIDHNYQDELVFFNETDKTDTLVLICDEGNENAGLKERLWAYVNNGLLPDYFSDAHGNETSIRVPTKYRAELAKHLTS